MRILGRLGMYLTLTGVVLATAIWADAPPAPWYLQPIQKIHMGLALAIIKAGLVLWLIAFFAKPFRRILICAGVAVGILLLITLALKADAYALRLRSECLLADVRSLQVRKTTEAEAQPVLQKWRMETVYFDPGKQESTVGIWTADSITSMEARHSPNDAMWVWVMRVESASRFMGWRKMGVSALIDFRKGVVWDKRFIVEVQTSPDKASTDGLYGEVATNSHFFEGSSAGSDGQILQTLVHPDYVAVQHSIRIYPDFMKASALVVLFTPSADPAVVRHFEDFDFSCMTRWFPCHKVAELMPTAWTQFQEDQPRVLAAVKQLKCTPEKVEAQARNAQVAAVVEATGNRTEFVNGQDHEVVEFRLVESLRPDKHWKTAGNGKIWVSPWMLAHNSTNASLALPPGQRFILLFFLDEPRQGPAMWPYPCGVIPWSETNLALVRHAIAEDARADDPDGVE